MNIFFTVFRNDNSIKFNCHSLLTLNLECATNFGRKLALYKIYVKKLLFVKMIHVLNILQKKPTCSMILTQKETKQTNYHL